MTARFLSSGEEHQRRRMLRAISLDQALYGKKPPAAGPLQKSCLIFFNLAGIFIGSVCLRWASARFANAFTARLTHLKSKRRPPEMDSSSNDNIHRMAQLHQYSRSAIRKNPAVLLLTAHPETSSAEGYRLGDLIYHVAKASSRCFPNQRMTLLQAIDDFALDSISWWLGGIYAGFVYSGFIAMNRMPGGGTKLQNILFHRSHYRLAIYNVLRALKKGNPLCLALGGGVVHNARMLYVFREFSQRIYFKSSGKIPKGECESKIDAIFAGDRYAAARNGKISEGQSLEILRFMEELGLSRQTAEQELKDFRDELSLSTPYRLRLMNILMRRLCGKGTPLLLAPFIDAKSGMICAKAPVLILECRKNQTVFLKWNEDHGERREMETSEFIKKFVREEMNGA